MLRRAYYKAYFPVDSGTPPLGLPLLKMAFLGGPCDCKRHHCKVSSITDDFFGEAAGAGVWGGGAQ